jgi:hypothetical protein
VKPKTPARRRWSSVGSWTSAGLSLPVHMNEGRTHGSYASVRELGPSDHGGRRRRIYKKPRGRGREGNVRPHRLSPWAWTGAIRSSWRSRVVAFRVFQALIDRRHGIGSASAARWKRMFPSQRARHLRPAEPHETYSRPQVPSGAMRSLQQETSFDMLGTRWGPRLNIARRRFFVRLKGPFLRPGQPHAKHRAQAAVNDRVSNRDAAPKASLTVASTVLKDWEA